MSGACGFIICNQSMFFIKIPEAILTKKKYKNVCLFLLLYDQSINMRILICSLNLSFGVVLLCFSHQFSRYRNLLKVFKKQQIMIYH